MMLIGEVVPAVAFRSTTIAQCWQNIKSRPEDCGRLWQDFRWYGIFSVRPYRVEREIGRVLCYWTLVGANGCRKSGDITPATGEPRNAPRRYVCLFNGVSLDLWRSW